MDSDQKINISKAIVVKGRIAPSPTSLWPLRSFSCMATSTLLELPFAQERTVHWAMYFSMRKKLTP